YETAAPVLVDLFSARQPQGLQLTAIQALAALPRAEVGPLFVEHWRSFSPAVRREVAEALFSRSERLPVLLTALEKREIPEADLDPARLQALRVHPDQTIRRRAEKALTGGQRADRKKIVEQYR